MANEQNLTPWQSGQSGNPSGAPMLWETSAELYKRYSLMDKEQLEAELKKPNLPAKYVMIINDIIRAVGGKDKSIDRFQDRTDGKAVQKIETKAIDPEEELKKFKDAVSE